jgi:glycolate oxidase FAD binding subunit
VKNVAGFDVSKLIVGSLGTLAIITKATFRVHPLPETTRRLSFGARIEQVFALVLALREAQLEPASITVHVRVAEARIEVVFEGFGPGVEAQSTMCESVAKAAGVAPAVIPSEASAPGGIEGQRQFCLKATFPPSEFDRIAREIKGTALAFPSLGVMHFSGPSTTDARGASYAQDDKHHQSPERAHNLRGSERALQLRSLLESLGGTLVVQHMPDKWREKIDAWGTPPPSFKLMRALKDRFDPQCRLNPGRFVGGL